MPFLLMFFLLRLRRVRKLARATFQKGVCGKCSRQKVCQRVIVLSSAPKRAESSRTRRGDGSRRMGVLIRIMMAAR